MIDSNRRPRRRKPRRELVADLAVVVFPPQPGLPQLSYGPFTSRHAESVAFLELKLGRKVQIVPWRWARSRELEQ